MGFYCAKQCEIMKKMRNEFGVRFEKQNNEKCKMRIGHTLVAIQPNPPRG
jgi:hypothetical protein